MCIRALFLAAVCLLVQACGGDKGTPTAPSGVATPNPAPAPAPAPAPPPSPQLPSMTGDWSGFSSFTITERGTGRRASNICTETWVVTSQVFGNFAGTFQSSGGSTISCASSGTFAGIVSTNGTVSLTFTAATDPAGCVRIGGNGVYAGVVSGAGALTAQTTDAVRCTTSADGTTVTVEADRSIALTMNKR